MVFHDTTDHVTTINSGNAYLTLAEGSRCLVVSSERIQWTPCELYVDVMLGSVK